MKIRKENIIVITKFLFVIVTLLIAAMGFVRGGTITGTLTVPANCPFTVNNGVINFGSVGANSNTLTNNGVQITNGGNTNSNVLIYGANWILTTNSAVTFYVTNTLWAATSQAGYTGTALTLSSADTNIVVPRAAGTNNIFFGVNVPWYQTAGTYNQIITYSSSCVSGYTITGTLTVPTSCSFSASSGVINFGSIEAGSNSLTNNVVQITNTGNANSNIIIYGANWLYSSNSAFGFYVTNTLWAATSQAGYTGTALTLSGVDTNIYVPKAAGTNNIFFGVAVPLYQIAATYNQIITYGSSC